MPYRRNYRKRGPRPTRRTSRRRYTAKRPYTRPTKRMVTKRTSRRRILNISSKKKRNNVPPVNFNYQGLNPIVGPKVMGSDRVTFLLWRPTALTFDTDLTTDSARNAQTIFWRGIREHAEVVSNSGAAWRWRRIVFSTKVYLPGLISNVETSNGFPRAMIEMSGSDPITLRNQLEALIFQGQAGQDWVNVFHGKLDNNRIRVHFDRTRHLQSGNDRGKFYTFKQWIPLNKNMMYDDDERGKDESAQTFASQGIGGLGDVYVYDMFECTTSDASFQLSFNPQATLYWHER